VVAGAVEQVASCAIGSRHYRRAGVGAGSRRDCGGGAAVRVAAVGDDGGDGDNPPGRTTGL